MHTLEQVAPTFIEMAHSIVWCSVATVDGQNRPRSRVLHPIWEWGGSELMGWIATAPTPLKLAHLAHSPYLSCNYWTPAQDTAVAECRAEWVEQPGELKAVWDRFVKGPEPVGYDPAIIPGWDSPSSPMFRALRLTPWRLRVMPASVLLSGGTEGEVLTWVA